MSPDDNIWEERREWVLDPATDRPGPGPIRLGPGDEVVGMAAVAVGEMLATGGA